MIPYREALFFFFRMVSPVRFPKGFSEKENPSQNGTGWRGAFGSVHMSHSNLKPSGVVTFALSLWKSFQAATVKMTTVKTMMTVASVSASPGAMDASSASVSGFGCVIDTSFSSADKLSQG